MTFAALSRLSRPARKVLGGLAPLPLRLGPAQDLWGCAPRDLQRAPSSPYWGLADEDAEVGQETWVHRKYNLDQPSRSRSKRVWPQRNTPTRISSADSVRAGRSRKKSFTHQVLTVLCPWRGCDSPPPPIGLRCHWALGISFAPGAGVIWPAPPNPAKNKHECWPETEPHSGAFM